MRQQQPWVLTWTASAGWVLDGLRVTVAEAACITGRGGTYTFTGRISAAYLVDGISVTHAEAQKLACGTDPVAVLTGRTGRQLWLAVRELTLAELTA
jgi:hypothetical protein